MTGRKIFDGVSRFGMNYCMNSHVLDCSTRVLAQALYSIHLERTTLYYTKDLGQDMRNGFQRRAAFNNFFQAVRLTQYYAVGLLTSNRSLTSSL